MVYDYALKKKKTDLLAMLESSNPALRTLGLSCTSPLMRELPPLERTWAAQTEQDCFLQNIILPAQERGTEGYIKAIRRLIKKQSMSLYYTSTNL